MPYRYILMTAAKNEEAYIGKAIESVLRQSVHPLASLQLQDDGSTDRTAEVCRRVCNLAPVHQALFRRPGREKEFRFPGPKAIRSASQVAPQPLDFEFVGVHDADIAPERDDYYCAMLRKFQQDSRLGIVGGYIHEFSNGSWRCRQGNAPDSVAGGIQMFRRICFEQIGGYTPFIPGRFRLARAARRNDRRMEGLGLHGLSRSSLSTHLERRWSVAGLVSRGLACGFVWLASIF